MIRLVRIGCKSKSHGSLAGSIDRRQISKSLLYGRSPLRRTALRIRSSLLLQNSICRWVGILTGRTCSHREVGHGYKISKFRDRRKSHINVLSSRIGVVPAGAIAYTPCSSSRVLGNTTALRGRSRAKEINHFPLNLMLAPHLRCWAPIFQRVWTAVI